MAALADLSTLYFPAGIAIGLGAAAPIGPVNILVIQRALAGQAGAARLLGLGAALGDALFAIIAAFGLGAIGALLAAHAPTLRLVGGLVMLGFAIVVWRSAPHVEAAAGTDRGGKLVLLGFSVAATNPATLLFFVGSFSAIGFLGLGQDSMAHRLNSTLLALGVLLGAMLWWVAVAAAARRLRGRIKDAHLRRLNHGTAIALALFGAAAILLGLTDR